MENKIYELQEEVKRLNRKNSHNSMAILLLALSIVLHALLQTL